MIIFLRGLPGTGKTVISNKLAQILRCEVIHVDDFKGELMKRKPGANFLKEVVPYSYERTLDKLSKHKGSDVVVEEIFRNEGFVQRVMNFCDQNKIKATWFKITRDRKFLLEVDDKRTRKIKNDEETLMRMEDQIHSIRIDGEVLIDNQNIEESVNMILGTIDIYDR